MDRRFRELMTRCADEQINTGQRHSCLIPGSSRLQTIHMPASSQPCISDFRLKQHVWQLKVCCIADYGWRSFTVRHTPNPS